MRARAAGEPGAAAMGAAAGTKGRPATGPALPPPARPAPRASSRPRQPRPAPPRPQPLPSTGARLPAPPFTTTANQRPPPPGAPSSSAPLDQLRKAPPLSPHYHQSATTAVPSHAHLLVLRHYHQSAPSAPGSPSSLGVLSPVAPPPPANQRPRQRRPNEPTDDPVGRGGALLSRAWSAALLPRTFSSLRMSLRSFLKRLYTLLYMLSCAEQIFE